MLKSIWAVALLFGLLTRWPIGPRPTGSIEGRVTLREAPRTLAAGRYPGAGGGAPREVKPLPAVVYLEGRVGEAPVRSDARMAQHDTAFAPPLVVVSVGSAIEFPNEDPFFHNVFSYSRPKRFDLGRYPRGESKRIVFDQPGTISVLCEIHKWMQGAIVVVENEFHAVVSADGTFAIPSVPPGKYRLVVWQSNRGSKTLEVEVPDGGTARVDVSL